MTDEQIGALRDALAPLQEWGNTPLDDLCGQLENAVRVCKALALNALPYQPPTEEQIERLVRYAKGIGQGFFAAGEQMRADEIARLAIAIVEGKYKT